jgi:energy-coupling factor transport system ATP-binding protein
VRLRDLHIRHGDDPVVRIPSLDLAPGGYTLIAGPTGCGKSTLALALVGLAEEMTGATVDGTIEIVGRDIRGTDPGDRAGLVAAIWQRPDAQVFRRSVIDEVQVGLDYRCLPAPDGTARARRALHAVGLGPSVLVLDEAFSQLDDDGQAAFSAALRELRQRRGTTVVALEHRPDPHLDAADRVLVLDGDGTVAIDGEPGRVFAEHRKLVRRIGVREPTGSGRGRVVGALTPPRPAAGAALSAESLRVVRRRTTVLESVDLELPCGAIATLTGPNGAGKSSLLAAIAGRRRTSRGTIRPGRRLRIGNGIGYAPQRGGELMLTRTVRVEVALAHPPCAAPTEGDIDRMLDAAGLLSLADRHPLRLSGGQRQRLSVLLACVGDPGLVLLDEPTHAQDARGVDQVLGLVREGAADRVTVIATHEPEAFDAVATHRLSVRDGALVGTGAT